MSHSAASFTQCSVIMCVTFAPSLSLSLSLQNLTSTTLLHVTSHPSPSSSDFSHSDLYSHLLSRCIDTLLVLSSAACRLLFRQGRTLSLPQTVVASLQFPSAILTLLLTVRTTATVREETSIVAACSCLALRMIQP